MVNELPLLLVVLETWLHAYSGNFRSVIPHQLLKSVFQTSAGNLEIENFQFSGFVEIFFFYQFLDSSNVQWGKKGVLFMFLHDV